MKKRYLISICTFVFLSLIFLVSHAYSQGNDDLGFISLVILPSSLQIFIYAPLNETINIVNVGCDGPFIIDLNVSANFDVDSWWYTLESLKNGINYSKSDFFTPNTTIQAFRWQNRLTVFANDSNGFVANKSVVFYVNVSNHVPILGTLEGEKFICESLTWSYMINATDCDEDVLNIGGLEGGEGVFFIPPDTINIIISGTGTVATNEIISNPFPLTKNQIRSYNINVSVADWQYSDKNKTIITVIEINNPPRYYDMIAVSRSDSVWTKGENSTFYREFNATDIEDGNQDSGNLSYNISFSGTRLFNISNDGKVNYIGNDSDLGGQDALTHFVTVCATDLGIPVSRRHPQIFNECGQNGTNQSNCVTFQLTVTNENRQPTITSFAPKNLTFRSFSTDVLYFNITKFDPDGTIPDGFWYVDGNLVEYDNLSSFDEFTYNFGCDATGEHNIRVDVTDGELNDTLQWNVTLDKIDCPIPPSGGGRGGGVPGKQCDSIWACFNWNVCQNSARSLEIGTLSGEDYRIINEDCLQEKLDRGACGFQIRSCFDVNNCNSTRTKPAEIQSCLFTINPSCSDKIKNCHSGSCEFLVDCGGPCGACATCTDKMQNQGEQGIDCGGPCPFSCPVETAEKINFFRYLIWLLILLLIIAAILIHRVMKLRKKLKREGANRRQ